MAEYQVMVGKAAATEDTENKVDAQGDDKHSEPDAGNDAHNEQYRSSASKEKLIDVGARKRRKTGKVVGGDVQLNEARNPLSRPSDTGDTAEPRFSGSKKKKQKLKLSFDE
jgi:hypothetical protein